MFFMINGVLLRTSLFTHGTLVIPHKLCLKHDNDVVIEIVML